MAEMIAYCGLVCTACPAYIATQANDRAALEQVAASESAHSLGQRELALRQDIALDFRVVGTACWLLLIAHNRGSWREQVCFIHVKTVDLCACLD